MHGAHGTIRQTEWATWYGTFQTLRKLWFCCRKSSNVRQWPLLSPLSKLNRIPYNPGTHRPTSIEAIKMPLENPFTHRRRRSSNRFSWGAAAPIQWSISIGGAVGEGSVRRYSRWLVVTAESWLRPRERCAEGETAQETAGAFLTVTSQRVHRLWRGRRGPGGRSATMDFAEWSGVGFLDIICLGVGVRKLVGLVRRRTVVKNRAGAADRVNGPPSEREGFGGAGLLAHNVGKEWGGRRGNGDHFWRVCIGTGVDVV